MITIILSAFMCFPIFAHAEENRVIRVALPENNPSSVANVNSGLSAKEPVLGRLEAGVSTWAPRSITESESTLLPQLTATWTPSGRRVLLPRLGAGFLLLQKQGEAHFTGTPTPATQDLFVFTAHLGGDLSPYWARVRSVCFRVGADLMPTLAWYRKSVLGDQEARFQLGGELTAGAEVGLSALGKSFESLRLNLDGVITIGRSSEVDLTGSGFRAGLGFEI